MADQLVTPSATQVPAPTPAPAPAPGPSVAPPPQPSTTQPVAPAPAPEPSLSSDQVVAITRPDGTEDFVRMGDLVNAYRNRPDLGQDEIAELRTVRDALQGKPEAIQKLVGSAQGSGQGSQPTPAVPASAAERAEIDALKAEIEAMRTTVREAYGVTAPIRELQERNHIQATIQQHAQYIPYLAKAPEKAAAMVRSQFYSDLELAKQGQHPAFPGVRLTEQNMLTQHRDKILGLAMKDCERRLSDLLSGYGVTLQPSAATPQAPPTAPAGLVDDQTGQPTMRPAQVRWDPARGMFVNAATGNPVAQNRLGHVAEIPTDSIAPTGGGTPIPVGSPTPARGTKFDLAALQQRMVSRLQQVNANQNP